MKTGIRVINGGNSVHPKIANPTTINGRSRIPFQFAQLISRPISDFLTIKDVCVIGLRVYCCGQFYRKRSTSIPMMAGLVFYFLKEVILKVKE
jgi:hypothetical protein